MANLKIVNSEIKKLYPTFDIKVIRGQGYVYFDGEDGFDKIDSLYVNPTSTTTNDLINMVADSVNIAILRNFSEI